MRKSEFAISNGKGFSMTFNNGVTISVQFSESHYCERRHVSEKDETRYNAWDRWSSSDSEIAIFIKGKWITKEYKDEGDDVIGYQTPDQVAEAIKWARNYKVINEGE